MKTGTLTIFQSENYGAQLQAYALCEILRKLGHESYIINYTNKDHFLSEKRAIFEKTVDLNAFIRNLLSIPNYRLMKERRNKAFKFIRQYLPVMDGKYGCIEDFYLNLPKVDALICGSDQIWKVEHGKYIYPEYYLSFCKNLKIKSVAYAPSFGKDRLPEHLKNEVKELLLNIGHLSVREIQGKNIIKELTGREAEVVLDPSLLLKAEEWKKIKGMELVKGPYILVYCLERSPLFYSALKELKTRLNITVVVLSVMGVNLIKPADYVIYDAGPQEFLSLIANASCVFTNSFHGTAFSIIFRKPFISIPHTTLNSRISTILETLELSHRQIRNVEELPEKPLDIDYSISEKLLDKEIMKSIDYLKRALEA